MYAVTNALEAGEDKLVLPGGDWISLDYPEFADLKMFVDEADQLLVIDDKRVQVSRFLAGHQNTGTRFAKVSDTPDTWKKWENELERLSRREATTLVSKQFKVPPGVKAVLRNYQRVGFEWLCQIHALGLGGILADDMGLGKTLQCLAFMQYCKDNEKLGPPFLIVAPASLVGNWQREAGKFTPNLRTKIFKSAPTDRELFQVSVDKLDVVIMSYAIFQRSYEILEEASWEGLILDEAQFVKNHRTKNNQLARSLDARTKITITGTPIENDVVELWAILSIVAPSLFPSQTAFTDKFSKPIKAGNKASATSAQKSLAENRITQLKSIISPVMIRRTKRDVAPELPEKTEQTILIPLEPAHQRNYDAHLLKARNKTLSISSDGRNFQALAALLKLRQVALDASLVDDSYAKIPSSKLNYLFDVLPEIVAEKHKVLLFSQFTSYLDKVAARLDEGGIPYSYLSGDTRDREQQITEFKSGDNNIFLISLKAGGFGLNLTEADYVFILDPWWNPAAEQQAIDRTHRIGQMNPVTIYKLIAERTVEEKVQQLQASKSAIVDALFGGNEAAFADKITIDEIKMLIG
jgi:SNF2 family DNA or RNA helicase